MNYITGAVLHIHAGHSVHVFVGLGYLCDILFIFVVQVGLSIFSDEDCTNVCVRKKIILQVGMYNGNEQVYKNGNAGGWNRTRVELHSKKSRDTYAEKKCECPAPTNDREEEYSLAYQAQYYCC